MNLKEQIFEKIKDGKFQSTFCSKCNQYNWPPCNNCKNCFKKTRLKKIDNKGILLEKSYSHLSDQHDYFGIGDFSGIRIIGTVDKNIEINDKIIISNIRLDNDRISLEFRKLEKKK
jgi:uncharacterized OB-fold protein